MFRATQLEKHEVPGDKGPAELRVCLQAGTGRSHSALLPGGRHGSWDNLASTERRSTSVPGGGIRPSLSLPREVNRAQLLAPFRDAQVSPT